MTHWIHRIFASLIALVLLLVVSTAGKNLLPLDDAYIYLTYAGQALEGNLFQYGSLDPPSSGLSSLLWGALVIPAVALARVSSIPVGLSVLCLQAILVAFQIALIIRLSLKWLPKHWWLAPVLLALSPYWVLGVFNGMETSLYGLGLLLAVHVLWGGSVWWLLLFVFCRPEAVLLGLAVLTVRFLRRNTASGHFSRRAGLFVLLAGVLGALWPWLITEAPSSPWLAKSLAAEPHPEKREFYLSRTFYFAARTLWFSLTGGFPQPPLNVMRSFLDPASWLVWVKVGFLVGGTLLALLKKRGGWVFLLWVAASLLVLNAIAWDAQHYRYLVPALPLAVLLASWGWFSGPAKFPRESLLGWGLLVVWLVGSFVPGSASFYSLNKVYAGSVRQLAQEQIAVGQWIDQNLPASARIASHDVGAIPYYGKRHTTDLIGLVTPPLAGVARHGQGALWEALTELEPSQLPSHLAAIPAWMPYLFRTTWLQERLYPTQGTSRNATGDSFEVWSVAFENLELRNVPLTQGPAVGQASIEIVDGVDIADLQSEAAHAYRFDANLVSSREMTVVRELTFRKRPLPTLPLSLIDGGRELSGSSSFLLEVRDPERDGLLLVRTANSIEARLEVTIGSWGGSIDIPRGETAFSESELFIPSDVLSSEASQGVISVSVTGGARRVFHWWLLQ